MLDLFDESSSESEPEIKVPRVYRERKTLNGFYIGHEKCHFRLTRESILKLDDLIGHKLKPTYENRSTDITSLHQIQIALNFFATGDHFNTIAAASGVHKKTVSNAVERVTNEILAIANKWIKLPRAVEEINAIKEGFYKVTTLKLLDSNKKI